MSSACFWNISRTNPCSTLYPTLVFKLANWRITTPHLHLFLILHLHSHYYTVVDQRNTRKSWDHKSSEWLLGGLRLMWGDVLTSDSTLVIATSQIQLRYSIWVFSTPNTRMHGQNYFVWLARKLFSSSINTCLNICSPLFSTWHALMRLIIPGFPQSSTSVYYMLCNECKLKSKTRESWK